jgi:ribosome-associated protein
VADRGVETVTISTPQITLGAFLKWAGIADTGGAAKMLAQQGGVAVNGVVERRRGRELRAGDVVVVGGREYRVASR